MPESPMICLFCGADCSTVEYVRDRKGRYACNACIERNRHSPPPASRATAAAGRSAYAAAPPAPAEEEDTYNLAPIPVAPPPPPPRDDPGVCPACLIRIPPDLGRCAQCGYDPKKGIQTSRKIKKSPTKDGRRTAVCPKCAYDLTGCPGTRCPECGAVVDLSRRRYDREESRRIAMWSYLKPTIAIVLGLAGIFLFFLASGAALVMVPYVIQLGIFIPAGVLVFFFCCLTWIGFDAPFHRVAIELTAVYVIADLIGLIILWIFPLFLFPIVLVFFVYTFALSSFLDLEYGDAALTAFFTIIARIVTWVAIFSLLA